jgi:prophage DNA circulation protein
MQYTSPSGKEITLNYEVGKKKIELKTGVFTFPGRDGAHVQHQGAGATSLPITAYFSGATHMEDADEFETMLIEPGIGELRHPYGVYKVVPTGDIERENDFVNGVGQSAVSITFTETIIDEEAAELEAVAADEIEAQYDDFEDAAADDFAAMLDTDDIGEQLAVQSALETQTQLITDNLKTFAASDKKTFADWLTSVKELKDNIKNLYKKTADALKRAESIYNKGLNIARLMLRIMKMPADALVSLSEKIQGYSKLTAGLINQYKNDPFGIEKIKKAYAGARLGLTGAIASIASGSALALAGGVSALDGLTNKNVGISSRKEAVEAANQIIALMDTATVFSDTKINQDAFVDSDSAAYIALQELVQASARLILSASFALPLQRTITLERDRNVIELCAEIYGSIDSDVIDQFIVENNLNIDEIQLIPMGREVSYYVQSA